MERKICPRKAEALLLAVTAVFLCLISGLYAYDHSGASAARYETFLVDTARDAAVSAPLPEEEEAERPVDINTAGPEELTALPGIGEKLADRIVEYREKHGPFSTVDELTNVSGIGEGKLEALRGHVRVG